MDADHVTPTKSQALDVSEHLLQRARDRMGPTVKLWLWSVRAEELDGVCIACSGQVAVG